MAKKQKYYRLDKILETDANYYMLLGERSNGKSFAVKEYLLKEAYENDVQFGYVRRWKEDIPSYAVEDYFKDLVMDSDGVEHIKRITNGEYSDISVYSGGIYFANVGEDLKLVRGKRIGSTFALTLESRYKSRSYPKMNNIVVEEFITDKGYIPNEVSTLMGLVSTIIRRRRGKVFLIGNTITRSCPYFSEWQLTNTLKMKQGDIDIYNFATNQVDENGVPVIVRIAVEYCTNENANSQMFFGKSSKMITSGEWETKEFLHLEERLEKYKCHYTMYAEKGMLRFCIKLLSKDNIPFIYIYPYTKIDFPDKSRVVSDRYCLDRLYSLSWTEKRTKFDAIVIKLLKERKVTFSDNLTGTDFFNSFNI